MSKTLDDINDDEIRIISSDHNTIESPDETVMYSHLIDNRNEGLPSLASQIQTEEIAPELHQPAVKRSRKGLLLTILAIVIILAVIIGILVSGHHEDSESAMSPVTSINVTQTGELEDPWLKTIPKGTVVVTDTFINQKGLRIFEPRNASAALSLGPETLSDSTIILATQAADIRGDNGQILGTFVLNGELKSQGESKAGFCAIIDGRPTIGIADATPMLEQALTEGGYFFRQYPLVVGGQAIENKPKGTAIRKALAEIGNNICLIVSHDKLTFKDFSELLTEAGVRNAIYLCGGDSYGFYINETGQTQQINDPSKPVSENISFIIWR